MQMDETLYKVSEKVKNFATTYLVDITKVPEFNKMYELYDPCTLMFFYRNKHIMIDLGTGNNNKINWPMDDEQEMIDILEVRGTSALWRSKLQLGCLRCPAVNVHDSIAVCNTNRPHSSRGN